MITCQFDHNDVLYLGECFTPAQLRHEIHNAELNADLTKALEGTAYLYMMFGQYTPEIKTFCESYYSFPWRDYKTYCEAALKYQKIINSAPKPRVALGNGRRIDIQAVKDLNDIVRVIEGYTKLRKSRYNRYIGKCPIHDDRDPSLTVYADSQTWHCFGACNTGGDVISFIEKMENCDFRQAVELLEVR